MEIQSTTEELIQKHRKEKKELQAKIQALKKTITKGDKKKKKEVYDEITKLEMDLEKKQNEELITFSSEKDVNNLTNDLNNVVINGESEVKESSETHKVSKAQRRRDKKATQQQERKDRILKQEEQDIHSARNLELQNIKSILKSRGLMINDIPSDGNCLYRAVKDQLIQKGIDKGLTVENLRTMTGNILRKNKLEFLPFSSHPETGEQLTDDQYHEYCNQVEQTTAWGGHFELLALAKALQCKIEVVQAKGPSVWVGNEGPTLTLTYHRHMYGLGEHYNSVQTFKEEEEEGEEEEENVNT